MIKNKIFKLICGLTIMLSTFTIFAQSTTVIRGDLKVIGNISGPSIIPASSAITNGNTAPVVLNQLTANGSGVTNTIPWSKSYNTNISLVFNGGLQTFTLPNSTNIVGFAYGSGTAGSISFFLTNTPVAYTANSTALLWLTTHPTTVTNGIISFTTYGTNMVAAYKESQ